MIISVNLKNLIEIESFLLKYDESSQFLINNLKIHGFQLIDHHNSGNFKAFIEKNRIASVFCLTRRGNLIIQSEVNAPDLVLEACAQEPIELKGFIGEWNSVEPVFKLFKKKNANFSPKHESKEIIYSYDLNKDDFKLQHNNRVRFLEPSDFNQWLESSTSYLKELSLPDDLSLDQKRRDFNLQIEQKVWWGLFEEGQLLSRVGLNSKGSKIGQVGGVYTPQKYRQKGFAKTTMFHMLKDCRDLHGHSKNILFTGEEDIPAQKLYESMGYLRKGSFALIL